jgi:hypothetical protein
VASSAANSLGNFLWGELPKPMSANLVAPILHTRSHLTLSRFRPRLEVSETRQGSLLGWPRVDYSGAPILVGRFDPVDPRERNNAVIYHDSSMTRDD